jgi:hypothetical protein
MSSSVQVQRYAVTDFNKIKNDGFSYAISDATMSIIQKIAEQVGAPEYIKTPQFEKRIPVIGTPSSTTTSTSTSAHISLRPNAGGLHSSQNRTNSNSSVKKQITDEDWDSLRKYQATVLLKKKGIENSIDLIRKHLNKITDKTYETLKTSIIDELNSITRDSVLETAELNEEMTKVGKVFFTIASGNGFFSQLYAQLYFELMEMPPFSFLKEVFSVNFKTVNSLFNDFAYCAPNDNYDLFCENNKVNEKRRALSSFYVNLMHLKVIGVDDIVELINLLYESLMKYVRSSSNNKNIVDEISEVLSIFILNGRKSFSEEILNDLEMKIRRVAEMNLKNTTDFPSITNKTIFKHMDMVEKLYPTNS